MSTSMKRVNKVETMNRIAFLAKQKHIEASDIRDACNVAETKTVHSWFRAVNFPSVEKLVTLTGMLGATLDDVMVTEDEDKDSEPDENG